MTFYYWIIRFLEDDGYRGVIARCIKSETKWKDHFDKFYKVRVYFKYLNACEAVMAELTEAWCEYERENDRSKIRKGG